MRLTVLGCSGSAPGPDGPASAYLLEHDGVHLLLDLGSGGFGALLRHLDPTRVDAILLSHLHPDHCLDVAPFVVHRRYGGVAPRPPVPLLGPAGTHDRLVRAYEPGGQGDLRDVFSFGAPAPVEIGPFRLRFARVNHPAETHAVRVEAGGRALVYSGDTGASADLVALATGADALLCEASFADGEPNPPDLHLTGREAGEHAAKAGVGRLLLTHVPPWSPRDRIVAEATAVHPATPVTPDTTYEV